MDNSIKDYSIEGVKTLIKEIGIPSFRAKQILSWLYCKGVSTYDEMSNLPKALREQLADYLPINYPSLVKEQESIDGTVKYLIKYLDDARTEMVALPSDNGKLSVCISSQSGCAMKCAFCATGQNGFVRNLAPGEIVDQLLFVQHDLNVRASSIVIMGQGEPFLNFDNVVSALEIINHKDYLNLGARHITVSTCGIFEGIERFSKLEEQYTLAVSLHAARQVIRDRIMPKLANQRLDTLRSYLKKYTDKTGRRFSFEYALMKGINDSQEDLEALIDYCSGLLCHINLIPLNEIDGSPFKPVETRTLNYWNQSLNNAHITTTIRKSRGSDIDAACGQLAAKQLIS